MRSPRGLLAVSGYLAGRHAPAASVPATGHHSLFFARTLQILAQPEPVRLQELSVPDSGILELRIERPEVKNAINWDVMRRLWSAIEKIQADATAKVVLVVSSMPVVFCAGADLKVWICPALPIPTIAVIEGAALGGGLELALSCDLHICGENAELGLPETGLAIIPGAGGTQRLPRIVGGSRAKELIFTGRRCDAVGAVMMGLANYCVPAGEAYQKALDIARGIMQKGPLGIRMAKKAINQGMEVADMSSALAVEGECYEQLLHTKDRLERSVRLAYSAPANSTFLSQQISTHNQPTLLSSHNKSAPAACFSQANRAEALAAFAEKRKPVYTGK